MLTNPSGIDDQDLFAGAPVGIQVVARGFEDEKLIKVAKVVAAAQRAGDSAVKEAM